MDQAASRVIRLDEVYDLAEFKQRTRIGDWGLRMARRKGLRMVAVGRRKFVRGADWFAFLDRQISQTGGTTRSVAAD